MRLLMRANAHRRIGNGNSDRAVEIAASPDTPGRREPWQWSIRLLPGSLPDDDGADHLTTRRVGLGAVGEEETLEVSVDPAAVRPEVEVIELTGSRSIERAERDLLALLVAGGCCLVEGRHRLRPRDAMVLEGDDPVAVTVQPDDAEATRLAVIRLAATAGALGWVP